MKQQKGFTLVEMAIVLVIIGLLLGGVLKGQELIDNSKIKNAMNDIKGVQAAASGYYDRFRALPGDDNAGAAAIAARGTAWTGIPEGDGDGILDVTVAQAFTAGGENVNFWRQLRAAGMIAGNPAEVGVNSLPKNAFGGLIGVTGSEAVFGMPANGRYVCINGIPGKAARAIDTAMDDGIPNSGSLRAEIGALVATTTAITAYVDENAYTLCTTM